MYVPFVSEWSPSLYLNMVIVAMELGKTSNEIKEVFRKISDFGDLVWSRVWLESMCHPFRNGIFVMELCTCVLGLCKWIDFMVCK